MKSISAEQMAKAYWQRLRYAAIKEIEFKLASWKDASASTLDYWLGVHHWLTEKAATIERKISK